MGSRGNLSPPVLTLRLHRLLAKRYKPPAWGFLHEVGNSTGFAKNRSADAIAMSIWPSRGLLLHGFEVKATRADWLKELKSPDKSAPIQKYCDFWWVVSEKEIVEDGELPPTWGLLERRGSKIVQVKEAPSLKPEPTDRKFLAALFRRLSEAQQEWVPKGNISDELSNRYQEGLAAGADTHKFEVSRLEGKLNQLQRRLEEFESASGISIDTWHYGKLGAAVRTVLNTDMDSYRLQLEKLAKTAAQIEASIDSHLEQLREEGEKKSAWCPECGRCGECEHHHDCKTQDTHR